MTLSHGGRAVVGTGLPTRPPVPSRRPIRGTPSEPVRADVRRVRHPVLGCKPSRLPLACGHHHCAPCLSYPNVVRSSCTEKDCASPFFIPTTPFILDLIVTAL